MQHRSVALFVLVILACTASAAAPPNELTPEEAQEGWELLFDGESFHGWRNYGAEPGAAIQGWEIQEGSLAMVRDTSDLRLIWNAANPLSEGLLDLMSERRFQNFELKLEWKISPGGNSGIFYLVPDESTRIGWDLAFEMQVLDNDAHRDGEIEKHRAGDLYDLKASASRPLRPVGEWNQVQIRLEGDRIQHWMNGVLLLDVQRSGPAWEAMLAESKFSGTEGYGQAKQGHLLLQDHGDPVWYRSIKIRELPATAEQDTASPEAP